MNLNELLENQIVIIDGAMGTMIQKHRLQEEDYRGDRFKYWKQDVKGNNDLLCLTRPDIIKNIHLEYLRSGAHIIETNTFNAQRISMEDYQMQDYAFEMNKAAAECARMALDEFEHNDRYVAGAIGPTNKTLSLSPDVNNPGYRSVGFDEIAEAYYEQIDGLVQGGVDVLLIETIFDTLNAKAAIYACRKYFTDKNVELPLMISVTITDNSGRTLSGQTLEAFYYSVEHASPLSVGLNCALGGKQMRPHVEFLSQIATCYVSAYPNAGLPNTLGEYDEAAEDTGSIIREWAEKGWVNIVGGCCGTTPNHIRAISDAVRNISPRKIQRTEI